MNTVIQKTKWMCVGLLLVLTTGTPAYADDTELLLLNPNAETQSVPNVLLVIDSSQTWKRLPMSSLISTSTSSACSPRRICAA